MSFTFFKPIFCLFLIACLMNQQSQAMMRDRMADSWSDKMAHLVTLANKHKTKIAVAVGCAATLYGVYKYSDAFKKLLISQVSLKAETFLPAGFVDSIEIKNELCNAKGVPGLSLVKKVDRENIRILFTKTGKTMADLENIEVVPMIAGGRLSIISKRINLLGNCDAFVDCIIECPKGKEFALLGDLAHWQKI